jgi:uncharacterized protein (DUF433 family)
MKPPTLVTAFAEARRNIRDYQLKVVEDEDLRGRMSYVRAWYADRTANGEWLFAPSKWTGYQAPGSRLADAGAGQRDGRETERALEQWYEVVKSTDRLHGEMFAALQAFLSELGQVPNKLARINKPRGGFEGEAAETEWSAADRSALLDRITSDPAICGGRPIIRGTRMRVSDILDLMAYGASQEEILKDYDYIAADDIAAALLYAARVTGHRTIRAA